MWSKCCSLFTFPCFSLAAPDRKKGAAPPFHRRPQPVSGDLSASPPSPDLVMVESEKKWGVDGEAQSAEPVSKVLDDDNLLIEILLRVGFPTTLVHAALVCKRWLHHASKPAFLSSFHKLHPPHLLGFYVYTGMPLEAMHPRITPRFVQMLPQPPELAVVVCHLKYDMNIPGLDRWSSPDVIKGFWNGEDIPPSSPSYQPKSDDECSIFRDLLSKGKRHGLLYVWSSIEPDEFENGFWHTREELTIKLYKFENGFWHMHTSATPELTYSKVDDEPLLVKTKVYMRRFLEGNILVWDLMDSSFFTIQLPEGVVYLGRNTMLSPADDTDFYLVHLNKFQLHIWLYSGDNWLQIDTICFSRFYAILGVSDAMAEDEYNAIIWIGEWGNKVKYVLLKIGQCALYLDIKRSALRKVYELTEAGAMWWDICVL